MTPPMTPPTVSRDQVLAWRLSAQGLQTRLPAARRHEAVRPVGLRSGGPDSAVLGWFARAEEVGPDDVRTALEERRWVEAPSLRGSRVVAPADLGTVTVGALPVDGAALRNRLRRRGVTTVADPADLLRDGVTAAQAALEDAPCTIGELSQAVTAALPAEASAYCPPCDAVHVDVGLFGLIELSIGWVRALGGAGITYVLPEQWLTDPPRRDPDEGAVALLAWHLRAHSPTTPTELAAYLGTGGAEAARRWERAPELAEVAYDGRQAWVPAVDLDALRAAVPAEGVRLLPPYDAALDVPDRATLVPDRQRRKEVWRVVANSGLAIVDGAVSCAWRARKDGRRLSARLIALDGWHPGHGGRIAEELAVVAWLRGAELAAVEGA
ncbi:MAG: crosslink repair DNA glycosylase YcaQ family protein [Blastococcus sp.]